MLSIGLSVTKIITITVMWTVKVKKLVKHYLLLIRLINAIFVWAALKVNKKQNTNITAELVSKTASTKVITSCAHTKEKSVIVHLIKNVTSKPKTTI